MERSIFFIFASYNYETNNRSESHLMLDDAERTCLCELVKKLKLFDWSLDEPMSVLC